VNSARTVGGTLCDPSHSIAHDHVVCCLTLSCDVYCIELHCSVYLTLSLYFTVVSAYLLCDVTNAIPIVFAVGALIARYAVREQSAAASSSTSDGLR
jgi:hypothetical protein